MTYKLTKNIDGIINTTQVQRISDGAFIPLEPDNTDYQKYLEWLEGEFIKGRTPTMVCPNTHCGCGICIVKAKKDDDFENIASKYIEVGQLG